MLEKLKAKLSTKSLKAFFLEHGPFLVMALLMAVLLLSGVAEANQQNNNSADTAFNNVAKAICTIVQYLRGAVGLAIIIIMFAIGGISLAIGGRNAMPIMIGAGIGAVIIASAPSFAKIFFTSISSTGQAGCGDGGSGS